MTHPDNRGTRRAQFLARRQAHGSKLSGWRREQFIPCRQARERTALLAQDVTAEERAETFPYADTHDNALAWSSAWSRLDRALALDKLDLWGGWDEPFGPEWLPEPTWEPETLAWNEPDPEPWGCSQWGGPTMRTGSIARITSAA